MDVAARSAALDLLLEVEGLRASFFDQAGEVHALEEVSFRVARGRTVALVGEAGCGKSVTALSVLGLLRPPGQVLAGSVRMRSRGGRVFDVLSLREDERALRELRGGWASLVAQNEGESLSPMHTIADQMLEALASQGGHRGASARRASAEMLESVGVERPERCLSQYPHQLEPQVRQLVLLALALVTEPELLIADEPTSALDAATQARVLALLQERQREAGLGMLLATRDLTMARQLADEVLVMFQGRVVERGPTRALLNKPRHPYVMSLVAALGQSRATGERLRRSSVPPAPGAATQGCAFHYRCAHGRGGLCDVGEPPPLEATQSKHHEPRAGHWVACHRAREIALERLLQQAAPLEVGSPPRPASLEAREALAEPRAPSAPAASAHPSDDSVEHAWFEEGERLSERYPGGPED